MPYVVYDIDIHLIAQIEEKKYVTELIERGIKNIKKLAVVFSGKDVYVKEKNNPRLKNR